MAIQRLRPCINIAPFIYGVILCIFYRCRNRNLLFKAPNVNRSVQTGRSKRYKRKANVNQCKPFRFGCQAFQIDLIVLYISYLRHSSLWCKFTVSFYPPYTDRKEYLLSFQRYRERGRSEMADSCGRNRGLARIHL